MYQLEGYIRRLEGQVIQRPKEIKEYLHTRRLASLFIVSTVQSPQSSWPNQFRWVTAK